MSDNMNDETSQKPNEEYHEEFEEEFNFDSHSESSEGEQEAMAPSAPTVPPPSRKTALPLIIGIAIAAFVGWKIYGMLTAPKTTPPTVEQQPKLPAVPPPPATRNKPETAKTPPPQPDAKTKATPETSIPSWFESEGATQEKTVQVPEQILTKLQKKIETQETTYKQSVQLLQKDLENTIKIADLANKSTAALQREVTSLSVTVQSLSAQLKSLQTIQQKEEAAKAAKARAKAKAEAKEAFATPTLTVYAIIPGRAWLRTSTGKTLTVTEGDPAGEYGKVLKIDAANGTVVTTSGVTLR